MQDRPLLSVLIPAYNQAAGVERILDRLVGLGAPGEVEVRVSDDSTDDAAAARMAAAVAAHASSQAGRTCVYQRNHPRLGAVPNWNALLSQARGRYVWLLHHDEEPDEAPALAQLLAELRRDRADIWILRCRVQHRPGARPRLHFPPQWTVALLRRWPGYLLRRNLIGAPSALIVRDSAIVRYDESLIWLVDVEAYVRMLAQGLRLAAWPQAGVLSRVDAVNSITAGLQIKIKETERIELGRLAAGQNFEHARPLIVPSPNMRLLLGFEWLAWKAFRLGSGILDISRELGSRVGKRDSGVRTRL